MKNKGSLSLYLSVILQLNTFIGVVLGMPDVPTSSFPVNSSIISTMETPGPWSEILENWIVSEAKVSRAPKVLKLGDKTLTVTNKGSGQYKRDVSETDLYLLGAIEKLVYRVDFLENRLRRAEELLYYVISGNIHGKQNCPANYTKIGPSCYHFSNRDFDWKSSASLCRGMGGHLVEFETEEEKRDVTRTLQNDNKLRGKGFWTGGLNPGLLWIWAGSAKPVYKDTKQTTPGDGRCLKLSYDTASKSYSYRGDDCGARHRYVCKLTVDDESANKIERMGRQLKTARNLGEVMTET